MAGSVLKFLTTASLLAGTALGYATPNPCSGTCVNTHDPTIIRRDDGTYFRLSTGGRIAIHSAPDITGPWTYIGAALPDGSTVNKPGNDDLWAPEVLQVGSDYYLYYSVSTFGSQDSAIGVARSSDLETWTDLGSSGVESVDGDPYNAIDPHVILVGSEYFMSFGSFWTNLYVTPMLSPPERDAAGERTQIAAEPVTTAVEAPFIFPNGGFYYLFYSLGQCCGYDQNMPAAGAEYKIMVCRSESATGGYVDQNGVDCTNGGGTVVLESHDFVYGPGGQGVYNDPSEGPILYYHYVDTNIGYSDGEKQFGWNNIDFSSGWPVV